MPTARARLTITETDDVVRLLDEAAELWPQEREHRAVLLKRLAERGVEAARADRAAEQRAWTSVVEGAAGAAGPDAFGARYLADLRSDWPE